MCFIFVFCRRHLYSEPPHKREDIYAWLRELACPRDGPAHTMSLRGWQTAVPYSLSRQAAQCAELIKADLVLYGVDLERPAVQKHVGACSGGGSGRTAGTSCTRLA